VEKHRVPRRLAPPFPPFDVITPPPRAISTGFTPGVRNRRSLQLGRWVEAAYGKRKSWPLSMMCPGCRGEAEHCQVDDKNGRKEAHGIESFSDSRTATGSVGPQAPVPPMDTPFVNTTRPLCEA